MSLRDGPLGDIKPPMAWLAAGALVLAILAAAMVFLGGRRSDIGAAARRPADGAVGGVARVASAPLHWGGQIFEAGRDYFLAGWENHNLRAQLRANQSLRDEVAALREENARFRALLGVKTDPPLPMVFARTVLDARGPFANTRLADAGADRGVVEGNPVMSEHGLVGRVTGVGRGISRIMLLTDVESRTPVLVARTNGRAILTGDGGPNPKLDYLRTHDPLREGDRILTSGDGGVFPRGLPVGVAVKAYDGGWRVALDADASPIDYVQILRFTDFAQVAPPGGLAPSELPPTATEAPTPPTTAAAAPAVVKSGPAAATRPAKAAGARR